MQLRFKDHLITILLIIVFFNSNSNLLATGYSFSVGQTSIETNSLTNIETTAQRLSFQIDESNNRHFIYQIGERPFIEPSTEPYNGTHVLKYATIIDNVFSVENVTDELVYPYHYEFRVDSLGQVHLAYITGNYSLFYTVRDPITKTWNSIQMNTPSEMFASMPSITLGTDEQPRLVYTVTFKEEGNKFFNQTGSDSLTGVSSLFYAVLNGSTWLYFDVGDNHDPFFPRTIIFQRIFNPGIKIEDGFAYIAFTNKVALAVETRLQYIKIPEIPGDNTFLPLIHQRAKIAPSHATTYRRPSIHLIGDGVLIAFGAWSSGAGSIIYLANSSALQNTSPEIAKNEWLKDDLLLPFQINRQVDSVVGTQAVNGTIYLTWSLYELFNQETKAFSHDVFLATIYPTSTEIGFDQKTDIQRLTNTNKIHHYSPSIAITQSDELIIYFISENQDGDETKLIDINPAELISDVNTLTSIPVENTQTSFYFTQTSISNTDTQTTSEITGQTKVNLTPLNTLSIFLGMIFITISLHYFRKNQK